VKFTSKHSTWILRLQSFTVLLAVSIGLQAQSAPQQESGDQDQAQLTRARVFSGKLFPLNTTSAIRTSNVITITAGASTVLGSQTFSLQLPADAVMGSLTVTLNGHDVSGRFRGSTGILFAEDGLSTVKNVLSATVKTSSGSMASGRWRSMNLPVNKNNARSNATPSVMARAAGATPSAMATAAAVAVCDPVNMCPAWLPPSVRFDTLQKGGWTTGTSPWFEVNGTPYGFTSDNAAGAQYVVVALNRQTLQITDFSWFPSSSTFSSYIAEHYTSSDLVIGGTTAGSSPVDASLDTSSIGGTDFATCKCTLPQSYMIVGSGGQAPGTAYENEYAQSFATGSLLEDANGNYNFQSSDIVEYAIEPQDPGSYGNPTIRMNVPANLSVSGESQIEFNAPALAGQNGLWLLVLDRTALMPPFNRSGTSAPCSDIEPSGAPTRVVVNCGTFYAVGAGNSNIDGEWHALASALSAVTSGQIVFLQSIGTVGSNSLAQTVESGSVLGTLFTGFAAFAAAVNSVGGTSYAVAGPTYTSQDNYALVGYLGAGNALTGGAAELSTAFPGQLGVLHGTLQRDQNGLYRPGQTSPEQQGMFNAKGGMNDSDFTLGETSYQQPVVWPSNSATVLLPGASTIAGQQAAYRFISNWLLGGYYMKTIQGPHQDDIHYFFSSSTNTSIDYHTMDPANLPLPTVGTWSTFGCTSFDGTTCTFQATGDSAASSFTVSDFNAVKAQLSLEVIYLTNTLQFLVTGSTNLKDVVSAGNANVGLALSAAANTIEGSGMANLDAQAIAMKTVSFSWQSLLGTLSGIAETLASIESFGAASVAFNLLPPTSQYEITRVSSSANAIGAILSAAGSAGGIIQPIQPPSPQPFAKLTTTVGNLATQDLQSPLIIAFDTTADNITSDWGRLSTIGPRTTNVNDTTFFAPNQVQQVNAINASTNASASTFYFSLLPTVYNMHVWNGVSWVGKAAGTFQPSVGSLQSHTELSTCNAFYLTPNSNNASQTLGTLSTYQGITYPSVGGGPSPFNQDPGYNDFWVIDGTVARAGSNNTNIAVIDADLGTNLFASNQLNVPMLQFFSGNGPMVSVEKDASVDHISGWGNNDVCDASDPQFNPAANLSEGQPGPGTGVGGTDQQGNLITTTTLISPMSGTLGHDMVFTAQVMAGTKPVTLGVVYISIDGAVVGNPTMNPDGTASVTVKGGLALGTHQVQADYGMGTGYAASSTPQPSTFVVYSESPDISVTVASGSMNVSYNAPSTPLAVQIGSIAGLSGNVVLSCTGLPAGLACTFNSQSLALAAGGSVNATVQVGPTTQAAIATYPFAKAPIAILMLLPLGIVGCLRRNRSLLRQVMLLIIAAGVTALALTGCSGGSSTNPPARQTGMTTITINASVGSVARSVGVNVNIQ
jgi:Bacterial Ig-like domain (group 3)